MSDVFIRNFKQLVLVPREAELVLPTDKDIDRCIRTHGPLPGEYLKFCQIFGIGLLAQRYFFSCPGFTFHIFIERSDGNFLNTRKHIPKLNEFRFAPEEGGLLAVGTSIDNDWFFWNRIGPPDSSSIVSVDDACNVQRYSARFWIFHYWGYSFVQKLHRCFPG